MHGTNRLELWRDDSVGTKSFKTRMSQQVYNECLVLFGTLWGIAKGSAAWVSILCSVRISTSGSFRIHHLYINARNFCVNNGYDF